MQEENFLKSNIDYENRLKEHIYQFEDLHKSGGAMSAGGSTVVNAGAGGKSHIKGQASSSTGGGVGYNGSEIE